MVHYNIYTVFVCCR